MKTLSSYIESSNNISIYLLAEALGCDRATLDSWIKDETLLFPKPIQLGKDEIHFICQEIQDWLSKRPTFNCYYDREADNFIINHNQIVSANSKTDTLINKQQALNKIRTKIKLGKENMFLNNTDVVIPCISIDGVDLFFSDRFQPYFSHLEKVSIQHEIGVELSKKEKKDINSSSPKLKRITTI
ncbi:putative transcriptional regulator [Gilliamella apicola SCGC AB-598-I20]|nr:putative transcriptional regulator [Gilliamella apicola SCGC AB-598-I20]